MLVAWEKSQRLGSNLYLLGSGPKDPLFNFFRGPFWPADTDSQLESFALRGSVGYFGAYSTKN